jgi:hypothetical protein
MESPEIFDRILRKFQGNKSFSWDDVHNKDFYESISSDYFVVENHLNFLIGDGSIQEKLETPTMLCLSRKGWFIMTNPEIEGYETKELNRKKRESRERKTLIWAKWATIFAAISIVAWLIDQLITLKK